jgi:hypothetical protein
MIRWRGTDPTQRPFACGASFANRENTLFRPRSMHSDARSVRRRGYERFEPAPRQVDATEWENRPARGLSSQTRFICSKVFLQPRQ